MFAGENDNVAGFMHSDRFMLHKKSFGSFGVETKRSQHSPLLGGVYSNAPRTAAAAAGATSTLYTSAMPVGAAAFPLDLHDPVAEASLLAPAVMGKVP